MESTDIYLPVFGADVLNISSGFNPQYHALKSWFIENEVVVESVKLLPGTPSPLLSPIKLSCAHGKVSTGAE